ncbi:ankyrin repeat domain-containing protein [Paenibacillus thiaminolyticus]|uniref:ankyrin repeat domain-containing protein n=1 Tax=Paenibacillus thiaminolyticus TaxID=49283 RepID=UPI002542B9F8|nr:ankyrin repeat domain-containing protein [Paenibacillus thiaminolyticus]WII36624.1 ankyrin repeat domain-containing protein [Paenibacillus thiaminolyticus]
MMLRAGLLCLSLVLASGCGAAEDRSAGGHMQAEPRKDSGSREAKSRDAALLGAAKKGKEVRKYIKEGADVNAQDGSGRTPAMLATLGGHTEVVRILIEAGADVNIQADNLDNPYLYAGAEGLLDILKLTIEAGADTKRTNRFGGTALIPAAEHAHLDVIEYLLTSSDVDVNHVNNLGWTALMEAVVLGSGGEPHQRAVELLIRHGADVNIPDRDGVTALSHAQSRGFTEIARLLEQAGAKADEP